METLDVTKPEICPRCSRQRVWALWRKCECGYDFGPEVPAGYSTAPQKSEPPAPRLILRGERCAMLVVSWMSLCLFWVFTFYGIFLPLLLWLSVILVRFYADDFRVGVPRWLRPAAFFAIGLSVLGLLLVAWFDVPRRPEQLAVAPPFHRFLLQVFPLAGIPLLVVAGYYFFLIITRRVTQAEPE